LARGKKTLLFITHSIPEAVFLGDRVVVMTPRPGKVAEIIPIDLPRPRVTGVRDDPKFIGYVRKIRERLGVQ
jgi:NitT/TauT family transport system ATP-binding protein